MSQESYNAFRAKLATDETLGKELWGALGNGGTAEALVAFARAHGYDFDRDDMKKASELSDDELASVAGGAGRTGASASLMLACATGTHIKEATITF